jgi:DNA-binding IclR family transcriptional regulator
VHAGAPEPQYPIASVDNALRLLLMFRDRGQIRLSEAASSLGVANSTAHRLLAMLTHYGFVRQDPATKWYEAGDALVAVGLEAVRRLDVRTVARPLLERLSAETGETVHCGVLEGATVRYVDAIESAQVLRVTGRTGTTLPAHCSSVGKALLARLDPTRLRELYPGDRLPQATDRSIDSFPELVKALDRVRRQGYAVNLEESEAGVGSIAVAIDDDLGRTIAAVSCAAPVSRLSRRRVTDIADLMVAVVHQP